MGRIRGRRPLMMLSALVVSSAAFALPASAGAFSQTFDYTGAQQNFVVPAGVSAITVQAFGAQGGLSTGGVAGSGGSVTATVPVTPGETLFVNVGGEGGDGADGPTLGGAGGFNGGGPGGNATKPAGGGGGASDVRQGGATLASRVLVAGGGGGAGGNNAAGGGDGGDLIGENGSNSTFAHGGGGGTQSAGGAGGRGHSCGGGSDGALGLGGTGGGPCLFEGGGGGGGGGYFGGGGGGGSVFTQGATGGGGSSFTAAGVTNVTHVQGGHTGDGEVRFTYGLTTTLSTTASSNITLGATVSDTATLAGGSSPTGTITFRLYGPDDASCTGSPVFTDSTPVSGNGNYQSASFTPTQAGSYRWIASYSGDANNDAAAGACNDTSETVTVAQATPAISTNASANGTLGGQISDTATLSGGSSPGGTISFRLYGPADATCAGAPVFTDTVPVDAGNGSYDSAAFTPTQAGTYRWIASYSGDADNDAVAGACNDAGESTTVAAPPTPEPDPMPTPNPTPPALELEIIGLERDRANGIATLTVATNLDGAMRVKETNKVRADGPVDLDKAGSAELQIVPRNGAAQTLRRTGRVTVNPQVMFAPAGGGETGVRHKFDLRLD